jgi:CRP-like cAMP-binding protein
MPRKTLPPALRKQLQSIATPERKEEGTILFRKGQLCRGAFLIRSGRVELSLDGASHLYPTRVVSAGSVIGLPAAFSGEPYSLTSATKRTCRLDFIPHRKLRTLLRRKPRVGFDIVKMLSDEIYQMRKVAKPSLPMIKRR